MLYVDAFDFAGAVAAHTLCRMNTPMTGSWSVEVKAVHPFAIHGDPYFELHVIRLDTEESPVVALRAARHAVSIEPQAGQQLRVTFLMGQVTSVNLLT